MSAVAERASEYRKAIARRDALVAKAARPDATINDDNAAERAADEVCARLTRMRAMGDAEPVVPAPAATPVPTTQAPAPTPSALAPRSAPTAEEEIERRVREILSA